MFRSPPNFCCISASRRVSAFCCISASRRVSTSRRVFNSHRSHFVCLVVVFWHCVLLPRPCCVVTLPCISSSLPVALCFVSGTMHRVVTSHFVVTSRCIATLHSVASLRLRLVVVSCRAHSFWFVVVSIIALTLITRRIDAMQRRQQWWPRCCSSSAALPLHPLTAAQRASQNPTTPPRCHISSLLIVVIFLHHIYLYVLNAVADMLPTCQKTRHLVCHVGTLGDTFLPHFGDMSSNDMSATCRPQHFMSVFWGVWPTCRHLTFAN